MPPSALDYIARTMLVPLRRLATLLAIALPLVWGATAFAGGSPPSLTLPLQSSTATAEQDSMDGVLLAKKKPKKKKRRRKRRRGNAAPDPEPVSEASPNDVPSVDGTAGDTPAQDTDAPSADTSSEGSGGVASVGLQRGNRMEFDGRLVRGETAGAGAVFLFERAPRPLPSMVKLRTSYVDETVVDVLGSSTAPEEEADTATASKVIEKSETPTKTRDTRRRKRRKR